MSGRDIPTPCVDLEGQEAQLLLEPWGSQGNKYRLVAMEPAWQGAWVQLLARNVAAAGTREREWVG